MSSSGRYPGAMRVLRGGETEARWLETVARSRLRGPSLASGAGLDALPGLAARVTEELALALDAAEAVPGTPALREVEKRVAFAGGTLAAAGTHASEVIAFVLALRDTLAAAAEDDVERRALASLFDWLAAVAAEGWGASTRDAQRTRHQQSLERGTPVVMVTPELPAVLFVADPERAVVEAAFGRVLLAVARVGARSILVDAGGLVEPAGQAVLAPLELVAGHRGIAGKVTLVVASLTPSAQVPWRQAVARGSAKTELVFVDSFGEAVSRGLARAGQTLAPANAP